jgi:hypothetical protein
MTMMILLSKASVILKSVVGKRPAHRSNVLLHRSRMSTKAAVRVVGVQVLGTQEDKAQNTVTGLAAAMMAAGLVVTTIAGVSCCSYLTTYCDADAHHWTPSEVAKEDFDDVVKHHDHMEDYPVYTSEQIAENDGTDGKPIWMSYGGVSNESNTNRFGNNSIDLSLSLTIFMLLNVM